MGIASVIPFVGVARAATFEDALAEIEDNPEEMANVRGLAELDMHEFPYIDDSIGMAASPQKNIARKRSFTSISDRALDLIVFSEVSSYELYQSKYTKPVWPGGKSGVTVAIGFDLGYTTPVNYKEDWELILDEPRYGLLSSVIGLTGANAKAALKSVQTVEIDYDLAEQQFRTRSLPCYVAETENAFANTRALSEDSFGALVSLVYNRGSSSTAKKPDPDDRRKEIRAIKEHMKNKEFDRIPSEITNMKRLWHPTNERGLHLRRDAEAALFAAGL
ncbi:hypothetical protein [Sinorhizobium fredii]|uniref:hypothetical protein n=1 Tax=Rhizobium fredii TaxID=380 RepID=UPI0005617311|nr:hypothetical protein [Sinorhizobium fredii]